jgi:hypothetical protein
LKRRIQKPQKDIYRNFSGKAESNDQEFEKKITNEIFLLFKFKWDFYPAGNSPYFLGKPMQLEQVEALVKKVNYPGETFEE